VGGRSLWRKDFLQGLKANLRRLNVGSSPDLLRRKKIFGASVMSDLPSKIGTRKVRTAKAGW